MATQQGAVLQGLALPTAKVIQPLQQQFVDGRSLVGEADPNAFARGIQAGSALGESLGKAITGVVDSLDPHKQEMKKLAYEAQQAGYQYEAEKRGTDKQLALANLDYMKAKTGSAEALANQRSQGKGVFGDVDISGKLSPIGTQDRPQYAPITFDEYAPIDEELDKVPSFEQSQQIFSKGFALPDAPPAEGDGEPTEKDEFKSNMAAMGAEWRDAARKVNQADRQRQSQFLPVEPLVRKLPVDGGGFMYIGPKGTPINPNMVVPEAMNTGATIGEKIVVDPALATQLGVPLESSNPAHKKDAKTAEKILAQQFKDDSKAIETIQTAADRARTTSDMMKRFLTLNEQEGTGPVKGSPLVLPARKLFSPDKIQEMQAIIAETVPSKRIAGSGTTTDKDMELFKQATVSMGNSEEANRNIANAVIANNQAIQDKAEFLNNYKEAHGSLSGANIAWNRYLERNPIFDNSASSKDFANNPLRLDYKTHFALENFAKKNSIPEKEVFKIRTFEKPEDIPNYVKFFKTPDGRMKQNPNFAYGQ